MADKCDDDPIKFAPGALESIEKLSSEGPEVMDALRDMLACMRQAHQAWKAGQYASFDDAMEAITGQRPKRVGCDDA